MAAFFKLHATDSMDVWKCVLPDDDKGLLRN